MNLLRGGKTTAAELFRREIGERVVVVHEAAIAGFFEAVGSNGEQQLGRYDAVIFFESAAVGGMSVEGGNPRASSRTSRLSRAISDCGNSGPSIRASWCCPTIRRSLRKSWSG